MLEISLFLKRLSDFRSRLLVFVSLNFKVLSLIAILKLTSVLPSSLRISEMVSKFSTELISVHAKFSLHVIFLLPCEMNDRKYDIQNNIQSSLIAINKWFFDKSKKQEIRFDKNDQNKIDVTFLRVNRTMKWFDNKVINNEKKIDISDKIKKIIFNNKDQFNNFNKKKFIIFFEGWERRKYINYDICGKSTYDGKIAIYYTASRFKKYIGNDIILKNNKRIFTCTKEDHLNDPNDFSFGDAEATILHEILHSLGAPSKCSTNSNISNQHVTDNENDILYKESGKIYLDFNNDDYYNHNLKECRDLKDSDYLVYK